MNIDANDLIALSDKNEYVVVSKLIYNDKEYYYIADINDSYNVKFCYRENDELIVVKDSELIMHLACLISQNNS